MNTMPLEIATNELGWWRVNVTSDGETRDCLYFARIPRLVNEWMRARVYVGMVVFCDSITCSEMLRSIQPLIEYLQLKKLNASVLARCVLFAAVAIWLCLRSESLSQAVPARFSTTCSMMA